MSHRTDDWLLRLGTTERETGVDVEGFTAVDVHVAGLGLAAVPHVAAHAYGHKHSVMSTCWHVFARICSCQLAHPSKCLNGHADRYAQTRTTR